MTGKLIILTFLSAVFASCMTHKPLSEEAFISYLDEHKQGLTQGERAPLEETDLPSVHFFGYNPGLCVLAQHQIIENGPVFDMATYSGIIKKYKTVGKLIFQLQMIELELYIYQSIKYANHPVYGQYYFLPFKDLSNGIETYGGGRYLDVKRDELGRKYILDFNKAYNPWCAYSDGYNCPVPPVENHLPIKIAAGEKNYVKSSED